MNSETLDSVLKRLNEIEKKIEKLERADSNPELNKAEKQPVIQSNPSKQNIKSSENARSQQKESHFLGYVGAGCILLASILLIKLSIDSGWLTPIRQCTLASIFSIGLIAFPFFVNHKDRSYISLLPAIGVASLHLTTYGSVFYHNLLNPILGILSISIIGLLSLWLLTKLEEESYAALAIFGTYLGAFFFHSSFSQLSIMALYLLVWDAAFSLFAIILKKRNIIVISSYLALGLVSFFGITEGISNPEMNTKIFIIQIIQFAIFSISTILFSIKNKKKLTAKESWAFFPVIVFFYGQEYFFLERISESWATIFSIVFGVFLLSIYSIAKSKLKENKLESGGVIYTMCSLIFAHSIFIVEMNDLSRLSFSLALIFGLGFYGKKILENKNLKGSLILAGVIILYSYLSILFGSSDINFNLMLFFGFVYGAVFLFSSKFFDNSKSNLILKLGHAQIFVSLFRLKNIIGFFAIAPLWTTYAFGILFWAYKRKDINMANGAIPLIVIGLLRFLVFDFSKLSGGQQVLSLLVMGILIFAGGYLYRKVNKAIT